MSVRIGLGLFTGQVAPGSSRTFAREYREMLELVRLAEATGFDSVWVSEHHGASDGYLPSILPMLGAFAAATERILLGTGLVLAPLHHPLRLAEDAAVVDQLSGGRLVLGLGIGWREEEFRMFGVSMRERALRTEETIEILRRAWTGRRFSFHGRAHAFDRVRVTPPPARPGGPPIYLGGYSEIAVRRAGRLADGYVADAMPAEDVRRSMAIAEEAARGAGRDPASLGLALTQNAFVWPDDGAWDLVASGVAHQLGAYEAWEAGADTPDLDELSIPDRPVEELRRWTPTGRPDEVAAALAPLVAPYADRADVHLIVRLHYPGMELDVAARAIELFASDVLPRLRTP
ncbi:MAG TPA: LLM class flavin-dependent oxidoreductase [Actinomycetota bacterium]